MVGILFIFLLLLTVFALNFRDAEQSYRQFLVTAGPVRRRRLRADGRSAWR
jgi:hypothetical protein